MLIRYEKPDDADDIGAVVRDAFAPMPFSDGSEADVVERLRTADGFFISLVAERDGQVVGHAGFSPITVNGKAGPWYQLSPVSVRPDVQRSGIGSALIQHGLNKLAAKKARVCMVLGDPAYYQRFGFAHYPDLADTYPEPNPFFMAIAIDGEVPEGKVSFHPAFYSD